MPRIACRIALLMGCLATVPAVAEVRVIDSGYQESKRGDSVVIDRTLTIKAGKKLFAFVTNGCSIGMVRPTAINWYSHEMCTVKVNGETFFGYSHLDDAKERFVEKSKVRIINDPAEGGFEMTQEGKQATVKLEVRVKDNDDKFSLQVTVESRQAIKGTQISFCSYPSTMEPADKLNRVVATAKRVLTVGPNDPPVKMELDKDEGWIFLHDRVYDHDVPTLAGRRAVGGCGLWYPTSEPLHAEVQVSRAHIDPQFSYGPDTTRMHFVLTDFGHDKSNAQALETMQAATVSWPQVPASKP
ncbi:MAG: hypothetical protein IT440_11395 [Phycisphaeraceae bacterium]|nr:hypothetical protein [Phycisphaeraceae bacterium]